MIRWPWLSRKKAEAELSAERLRLCEVYRQEREGFRAEFRDKWHPLLKRLVQLKPVYNDNTNSFMLHVALDRYMLETVASYNDEQIWDYIAEEIAIHVKRQLLELNFSGLHRMAMENEYRYHQHLGPLNPF